MGITPARSSNVIVIGGAPGSGKSTLGAALAARLGWLSTSMDDLLVAAQAITSPESHPGLHCMRRLPSHEYFTTTAPAELIADAVVQHEALWPAIRAVLAAHANHGPPAVPVVVDGWFVTPRRMRTLRLPTISAVWLVVDEELLRERESRNDAFFGRSDDPQRMLRNFVARSVWHNERIRTEARELGDPVIEQDGSLSPDALCDRVLELLAGSMRSSPGSEEPGELPSTN